MSICHFIIVVHAVITPRFLGFLVLIPILVLVVFASLELQSIVILKEFQTAHFRFVANSFEALLDRL